MSLPQPEHYLVVACPTCGANVSELCRTYAGNISTTVHVARQNLAHLRQEPPR